MGGFSSLFFVKIHHHLITDGMGLAGQDEALLDFTGLQAMGDVHVHLAFQQFGLAGRADATLAGIGQVEPGALQVVAP